MTDGVKRVEGDARGKNDGKHRGMHRHAQPAGKIREAGEREIEMLEEAEKQHVHGHGNNEAEFAAAQIAPAQHAKAREITDRGGKRHEGAEFVIPRPVKNVTGEVSQM